MLLPKSLRAAAVAAAGAFLLSALPAAAAPVLPSEKPAGIERSTAFELAATTPSKATPAKKKKTKKVTKKKAPVKKQTT